MRTSIKQTRESAATATRKRSRRPAQELAMHLAEREEQRQALVRSLKGKFQHMKFSSNDLLKQRRHETLLEGK